MARSPSLLATALFLFACGGSPPPPAEGPPPTLPAEEKPATSAGAPDESGKTAEAVEKITAEEANSGSCDAAHQAAVDKLLADVEGGMKPEGMQLVGKKVLALGPAAKSFEMSVSGRGTEVHVMAYAAKEVSMDVLVGTAAATTMRSPHQRSAAKELALDIASVGKVTDVQSDSRQVNIKPGQPLVVKVTGQGCAGIISFLKP
jgi:hypothetical protein